MNGPTSGVLHGKSEDFATAFRRLQLGLYQYAEAAFSRIASENPNDQDARYYLYLARRHLTARAKSSPVVVWQLDPSSAWESDWIRSLLGDCVAGEIVDSTWSHIADNMIVVDNRLVPEKVPYYRRAFENGARIVLIHLSDEAFRDDQAAYRYCEHVVRNYRSEVLADCARTTFFPLGFKAGFAKPASEPRPIAIRKYLWSFAGDAKKLTRAEMLEAMQTLPDGTWHLTAGFGTSDNLSTESYRALLDNTIVAPCPSGWANLETFRVYEALEAGCIPIVEKRPGFDYFSNLLGSHPIPTIQSWREAPELVSRWHSGAQLQMIADTCHAWWKAHKSELALRLRGIIDRSF